MQTLEEWWAEDADRHNAMGVVVRAMGFQAPCDPALLVPPKLNPDGSLVEPGIENRNPQGINQYTKGGGSDKGEGIAHAEAHAATIAKAKAKAAINPKPTVTERQEAKEGIAKLGANKYRRNLVGNTTDRAKRRAALLKEFGDGTHCPCVYCGTKLGEGATQLEQDKIKTTREGGRYRLPNLVPSCGSCNKTRSNTKWEKITWPV